MSFITIEKPRPYVTLITLNRPERMNAISIEMLGALGRALVDAEEDPEVRVVIITGAGRGFCSGMDIKDAVAGKGIGGAGTFSPMGGAEHLSTREIPTVTLQRIDTPIVCAINGTPTPPPDETPQSGSVESEATPTVEATVEPLRTPSLTSSPTSAIPTPSPLPQPPQATMTPTALGLLPSKPTPTALSLPSSKPTPALTPLALPISRDPAGLGYLWLVGISLIALGAGGAWLAYSFMQKGR